MKIASKLRNRLEATLYAVTTFAHGRLAAYRNEQVSQRILVHALEQHRGESHPVSRLDDIAFQCFSQFDEDGILLYILSQIGMGSRTFVDIGCGRPMGSNSANLLVNWSFKGVVIDGNASDVAHTRRFYSRCRSTMFSAPLVLQQVVDADNVCDILISSSLGVPAPDVLSLDIDGIDFWVLKSMDVKPRVIVAEFNPYLPEDVAVTVPLRAPITLRKDLESNYYGCSLRALVDLLTPRGYRFVGVSSGVNAFFVLDDEIPKDALPSPTIQQALSTPRRARRFIKCEDSQLLELDWEATRSS